jgi:CRP/FNR family cyclic AMP-dependent transcriptional regulator
MIVAQNCIQGLCVTKAYPDFPFDIRAKLGVSAKLYSGSSALRGNAQWDERMKPRKAPPFDLELFLNSPGPAKKIIQRGAKEILFSQGDPAPTVFYLQSGRIRLTVVSRSGKEAVIATLGPGDFLGEGCIAGQTLRMATAKATEPISVLVIDKGEMVKWLHTEHGFSDHFISRILTRHIRSEADLVDQLFNSSERRLARALLLLAQYGKEGKPETIIPKISQEVLAEMIGTTRPRVNAFMNKFRKLGYIDYNGGLTIHPSLLSVVLLD